MKRQDVIKMLSMADAVWPDGSKGDVAVKVDIYQMALRDYEADAVMEALGKCAQQCHFYPKPVDLIERMRPPKPVNGQDYEWDERNGEWRPAHLVGWANPG